MGINKVKLSSSDSPILRVKCVYQVTQNKRLSPILISFVSYTQILEMISIYSVQKMLVIYVSGFKSL